MNKFAVINPATGETIKEYPHATNGDIENTLASSHRAYSEWARNTTLAERVVLAQNAADLFRERKAELGAIINREMGKPLDQAIGEAEFSGDITEAFAKNAQEWLADEVLEVEDGLRTFVRKQGTGVVLGIMPWNCQVRCWASPSLSNGKH